MLALLCANELTFPDRDLATVEWDQYETYIITRADEHRRLAGRTPMTVAEFARWMEGTGTDEERDGKVVPSLTGAEFAQALSMTSIEPQRRYRRNWRNKLVDVGEKGWQIGKEELDKSETSVTTAYTFIRCDGTGFQEVCTSTPGHSGHRPNRSPTWIGLPASTSVDVIVSVASCATTNMPPELSGRQYRQAQCPAATEDVRGRVRPA